MSLSRASVLVGEEVQQLLASATTRDRLTEAWHASSARCGFSHPAYLRTWYAHYAERYTPVLCLNADDVHAGAYIALALDTQTGTLTGAGGAHAEYHAAYCGSEADPPIASMVRAALQTTHATRLALRFMESNALADVLQRDLARDMLTEWRVVARPLRRLESAEAELAALRKSGTRSKLKRLERLGAVRFALIEDADTLRASLDSLVDWYDLRIASLGGGLPFREDPRRREWLSAVIAEPESPIHASHLLLGETPIALHVGVRSRHRIALGVLAYDARYAAHSPAKLLLHSLFGASVAQGVSEFDLTPFGTYKDRYANTHDDVSIVNAECSPSIPRRAGTALRRRLRSAVRAAPAIESTLRTIVHTTREYGRAGALEVARRWLHGDETVALLQWAGPESAQSASDATAGAAQLLREWLALKLPSVSARSDRPSYRRLLWCSEHSEHSVGVRDGDRLQAWGFLSRVSTRSDWYWPAVPAHAEWSADSTRVISDDWCLQDDAETATRLVRALCATVEASGDGRPRLLAAIDSTHRHVLRAARDVGFVPLGIAQRNVRRGSSSITWQGVG